MAMQNRRDLLQAHRLMTQRASQALLCGEPDSPNRPLRRMTSAMISSVLLGVIAAGVFGVIGLLSPGAVTGLTQAGTLVVDTDTATAYVPCQGTDLCPAVNYASALLALDSSSGVHQVTVHQSALSGYTIGPLIGIAGLPQDLPTSGDLVRGPWSVCASPGGSVLVGGVSVGGSALGTSSAALVTADGQADWLVWDGSRLAISPQVMQTLFGTAAATTVPAGWLNALPEGPAFAAPALQGAGSVVTGPAGAAPVGSVYVQRSPPQDYALTAQGRLSPVTPVVAALLQRVPGAPAAQPISPSMAAADLSGSVVASTGLPATLPRVVMMSTALCVSYHGASSRVVTTGGTVPSGGVPVTGGGVDRVWLPAGRGALVGTSPGGTATGATWFLVSGGRRYALSSPSVAAVLGYDLSTSGVLLPASLVTLLPQGPALNPAAANSTG
jgi:type VII secretion protein EccB